MTAQSSTPPIAVIIAGANGSGKTTLARQLLPMTRRGVDFFNVDEIQRTAFPPMSDVTAAREFLARLARAESKRQSFGLETTLATRTYARRIRRWRNLGYHVVLHFIELPDADFAVQRVAQRVAAGGHDIQEDDIRRRFTRGLCLFSTLYQSLVSEYFHWFSDQNGLRLSARHRNA